MKVLVCGGRDYNNKRKIYQTLADFHNEKPITCIVHGGAKGADSIAGDWAADNKIETKVYLPDWKKHLRAAGILRNLQMLTEKPDYIIKFPGGVGTAHMKRASIDAGYKVIEIEA